MLEKDSIEYNRIVLDLRFVGKVNSKRKRYYLFSTDEDYLFKREYYIFDKRKNTISQLKLGKVHEVRALGLGKFAKFFKKRLVIGYTNSSTKLFIEEYDLKGNRLSRKEGLFPNNQNCVCQDISENMIIWITKTRMKNNSYYKLYTLNFKKNKLKLLTEIGPVIVTGMDATVIIPIIEIDESRKRISFDKNKYNEALQKYPIYSDSENYLNWMKFKTKFEVNANEISFKY